MKVAILGSGPSAAFAVLACRQHGIEPDVISLGDGHTAQSGAFFLHWLPPEFIKAHAIEPLEVEFVPLGKPETYSLKQWGEVIPTSFPFKECAVPMYGSHELDKVWATTRVKIAKLTVGDVGECCHRYDWVFHSFPINAGARRTVLFPVLDTRCLLTTNRILYNGFDDTDWVRCTIAFRRMSYEFPRDMDAMKIKPPIEGHQFERHWLRDIPPSIPPMSRGEWMCTNLVPIGRFATWDRKMLSHNAYGIVTSILERGEENVGQ